MGKFNWNAVRLLPERCKPANENWRSFTTTALKEALAQDFMVNTDSRSVIACAPWALLSDGEPVFAPKANDPNAQWREELFRSLQAPVETTHISNALDARAKKPFFTLKNISLEEMQDWQITDDAIRPLGDLDYDVCSYRVDLPGRERDHWDQPLLRGRKEIRALLLTRQGEHGAEFFFRIAHEPGFGARPQLGPSWQSDGHNPDWLSHHQLDHPPLLRLRQSDEGWRFMQSIVRYEIIKLTECPEENDGFWLTMSQIQQLCTKRGMLTNEARTLISMLLSYA